MPQQALDVSEGELEPTTPLDDARPPTPDTTASTTNSSRGDRGCLRVLACTHLWLQLRRPAHQMKAALKTNWNQQRQCALRQQPLASPFFAHHVQRRSLDQPSACLPSSSRLVPRHFNSPVRPASSVRRDTRHSLRTRAIWHTCSSGEAAQDRRHTRCTQLSGRFLRAQGARVARTGDAERAPSSRGADCSSTSDQTRQSALK